CSMATCFLLKSRECSRVIGVAGIMLSLGAALSLLGWDSRPAAAQATPPLVTTSQRERPWGVVILNDGDPTLPAFVLLDTAMRASLREPGRHPVDTFYETLDMFRFPGVQLEHEIVPLLMKKYAGMHIDAVITIGPAALDFAERNRMRIWPDAWILYYGIPF